MMAAFDVYNTVWVFSHPNAEDVMTTGLDFRLVGVGAATTEQQWMEDLNDAIIADLTSDYLPLLDNSFQLEKIDTFNINQPTFGTSTVVNLPGGIAGSSVSLRSAPVITKRTALRGRSFRGRMYMMACPEINQANGVLDAAYIAGLGTLVGKLQTVVGPTFAGTYNSTVYSAKLDSDQPINGFEVRTKMGSVRKRQEVI
jgi:hypothetical protein